MADPKDDDLVLDDPKLPTEIPDEGLEAEADAEHQDGDEDPERGQGEDAAEGDGSESQEEVRRPSRGETRFQTLSARTREATERASKAEQRAQELEARLLRLEQPRPQQPQGKTPEDLALMTPDELINYRLGEATKGFEQKLGQIQWATYESGDKASFQSLVSRDPVAARYADEVEQRLTAMRAQGQNVDRERLLTFIIGEKVRAKSAGAKEKQRGEGERRIQRQTVRPGAAQRSDTQGTRGKLSDAEAREKRLENMSF